MLGKGLKKQAQTTMTLFHRQYHLHIPTMDKARRRLISADFSIYIVQPVQREEAGASSCVIERFYLLA
jgi:hypothetical protein